MAAGVPASGVDSPRMSTGNPSNTASRTAWHKPTCPHPCTQTASKSPARRRRRNRNAGDQGSGLADGPGAIRRKTSHWYPSVRGTSHLKA